MSAWKQLDVVGQGGVLVHGLSTEPRISVSARFISERGGLLCFKVAA